MQTLDLAEQCCVALPDNRSKPCYVGIHKKQCTKHDPVNEVNLLICLRILRPFLAVTQLLSAWCKKTKEGLVGMQKLKWFLRGIQPGMV